MSKGKTNINKKNTIYLKWVYVAVCIILLCILNLLNNMYGMTYNYAANSLFLILTLYLYIMFRADISKGMFTPWKIFVYSFFAFYVFQIFSMQFIGPVFYDYPYEYKTADILLKSGNLFMAGSIMFFYGYEKTQKIKASSILLSYSIYSLNNRQKLIIYNYIVVIIALLADFYNSYIYMGSIFGRITTNYSNISLGSLSLLLYLYPVFLTNTIYIFLKYKTGLFNKMVLISLSILILAMQLFSGTRSLIFNFVLAAGYLYTFKLKGLIKIQILKKKKWKFSKIKISFILIVVYITNVIIQLYRQNKDFVNVLKGVTISDFLWQYDTFETYLVAVRHFPNIEPYKYFYSIKNLLMWVIPRRFYANKSIAFGKYLAYLVWPSFGEIPSAYAGITFGEFYANFGPIGMMISLLIIGIISGLINKLLGNNNELNARTLLYSYILMGLYGFYRGDFTTKTIHLVIPFIFVILITVPISILFTNKKTNNI